MRALVTGGGGFVGAALCRRLRAEGHAVTALGRRPIAAPRVPGCHTAILDLSGSNAAATSATSAIIQAMASPPPTPVNSPSR